MDKIDDLKLQIHSLKTLLSFLIARDSSIHGYELKDLKETLVDNLKSCLDTSDPIHSSLQDHSEKNFESIFFLADAMKIGLIKKKEN